MADMVADMGERAGAVLRYRVDGMDCPSCAAKIETAVRRFAGARDIRVNYGRQVLALSLNERVTSRGAVEDGIRKLGYGVAPAEAPQVLDGAGLVVAAGNQRHRWWTQAKVRLGAIISTLMVAGFGSTLLLPGLGGWPYLPAALLGLVVFGRKAVAAARAGSPFSIEMLMSVATVGAIGSARRPRRQPWFCCSRWAKCWKASRLAAPGRASRRSVPSCRERRCW